MVDLFLVNLASDFFYFLKQYILQQVFGQFSHAVKKAVSFFFAFSVVGEWPSFIIFVTHLLITPQETDLLSTQLALALYLILSLLQLVALLLSVYFFSIENTFYVYFIHFSINFACFEKSRFASSNFCLLSKFALYPWVYIICQNLPFRINVCRKVDSCV